MEIADKLNDELLKQAFTEEKRQAACLEMWQQTAFMYARTENAIAVLSDMQADTSYIYYGGAAGTLGLGSRNKTKIIRSIWEEEIFTRIHPDDLLEKHASELRFFHFLKNIPVNERTDYYMAHTIRMSDSYGNYYFIKHRLLYVASNANGSIRLALCLYTFAGKGMEKTAIIHSVNGERMENTIQNCHSLLSSREKEILRLIDAGMRSKEIAGKLSVSIHTVNRHRQNILEKLRAGNSIEACRIANYLNLLG